MDVNDSVKRSDGGFVSLVTQLSKLLHRRSTEELLGMRLKAYMALGYIRDHPGTTQQELENGLWMDANTVVLTGTANSFQFGEIELRGIVAVPEPSTVLLCGVGIAGVIAARRRRRAPGAA